jgi:hypothetical protein
MRTKQYYDVLSILKGALINKLIDMLPINGQPFSSPYCKATLYSNLTNRIGYLLKNDLDERSLMQHNLSSGRRNG